ncbi:MAG: DUF4411 family protein [Kyrpidia sp.]|nr:DUF4411 family protein [Kyrpidia sp.]
MAKADFAGGADGWLVAFARTRGYVVVTHEQFDDGAGAVPALTVGLRPDRSKKLF